MGIPGRQYTAGSSKYGYGFNGKERDNDIDGNNYDYGFRIYNPQIGRFLSLDPLQRNFPELTPYQFSSNSPIANVDLDGREAKYYTWTISYINTYQQQPNGTFKYINSSKKVDFEAMRTGIFQSNGPHGNGDMYSIYKQHVDVYLDVHGNPIRDKGCAEPRERILGIYVPSEEERMKDVANRPMHKGKIQVLIYGSCADNSESPGDRMNPNAITKSVDMNKFAEMLEPILLGNNLELKRDPKFVEILEMAENLALDHINEKLKGNEKVLGPAGGEKILEDHLTYNSNWANNNPVNQIKVEYGSDRKPKDTVTIWNQNFHPNKSPDTTKVNKKTITKPGQH